MTPGTLALAVLKIASPSLKLSIAKLAGRGAEDVEVEVELFEKIGLGGIDHPPPGNGLNAELNT